MSNHLTAASIEKELATFFDSLSEVSVNILHFHNINYLVYKFWNL